MKKISDSKILKDIKEYFSVYLIIGLFLLAVIFIVWSIYPFTRPPVITEYNLSEINSGVYVIHQQVVSDIPANNYEVATFSDDSGNVFTIKGDVNISYSEGTPKAILESRNYVYGNDITFYIPKGTVEYLGASGSGR